MCAWGCVGVLYVGARGNTRDDEQTPQCPCLCEAAQHSMAGQPRADNCLAGWQAIGVVRLAASQRVKAERGTLP